MLEMVFYAIVLVIFMSISAIMLLPLAGSAVIIFRCVYPSLAKDENGPRHLILRQEILLTLALFAAGFLAHYSDLFSNLSFMIACVGFLAVYTVLFLPLDCFFRGERKYEAVRIYLHFAYLFPAMVTVNTYVAGMAWFNENYRSICSLTGA